MRTSKFTEEQIVFALTQAEAGVAIDELCRRYGVSTATFYRWRDEYGGLGAAELKRLKELEQENKKLRGLVADLALDKQILQEALSLRLQSNGSLSHPLPLQVGYCAPPGSRGSTSPVARSTPSGDA